VNVYNHGMDLAHRHGDGWDIGIGKSTGKHRVVNVHTSARLPHHELELSHIPERNGTVQARKNVIYARPCVTILQPAQFNGPP